MRCSGGRWWDKAGGELARSVRSILGASKLVGDLLAAQAGAPGLGAQQALTATKGWHPRCPDVVHTVGVPDGDLVVDDVLLHDPFSPPAVLVPAYAALEPVRQECWKPAARLTSAPA